MGTDIEKKIAEAIRQGDNRAVRLFYAHYGGQLTAVCSRYVSDDDDVKDVMQDAMLSIISHIDSFTYRGKGSFKAWATRIVVNRSISFIRQKRREEELFANQTLPDVAEEEPQLDTFTPEIIHEAIRALPDGYRMVFNLFVLEGKNHHEIAEILGIKPDSSASQLHRAKRLLAKELNKRKRV